MAESFKMRLPVNGSLEDDLNFSDMTLSSDEDLEGSTPLISRPRETPKDRYNRIYIAFFFCGIATLLPWNFFITAIGYFKFKLRNTTLPENATDPNSQTYYQLVFENYLVITSSTANAIFMIVNTAVSKKFGRTVRYSFGTVILFVVFVVVIVFTRVNTDEMQEIFFYVTLSLGILFSAGSSFTQGSVMGMAGIFPDRFPKAVMEGMAIGGIAAAVANILTLYIGSDPVTSGLLYFVIGFLVIVLAFVFFLFIPLANFSRFYIRNAESTTVSNFLPPDSRESLGNNEVRWTTIESSVPVCEESVMVNVEPTIANVLWQVKGHSACLFITFLVSLAVFPAVLARIEPVSSANNSWTMTYFTPVCVFLLFNLGDYLGRFSSGIFGVLGRRFPYLHIFLVIVRLLFIPLTLLCNIQPRSPTFLPVLLNHDVWPGLLSFLIGLSNGYLATSSLLLGVSDVPPSCMEIAGNIMSMFMVIGISVGCAISFGLVSLV